MKKVVVAFVLICAAIACYWIMRPREKLGPLADAPAPRAVEPPPQVSDERIVVATDDAPVIAAESEPDDDLPAPAPGEFRVQGRVVNEDGAPVEGARLALFHDTKSWGLDDAVADQTVSEANGAFFFPALVAFDKDINHSYTQDTFIIVAKHPDYGIAWKHARPGQNHAAYVVTMPPGTTKTITVVDQNYEAIEGALVWPYNMYPEHSREKQNHFNIRSGPFEFISELTNRDGEAVFTGLPDLRISFHAAKTGYATGLAFSHNDTIMLTRGATVSGRVTNDRNRPVEGAVVSFSARTWNNYIRARTNEDGYYVVNDIPAKGFDMSPWSRGKTFGGGYTVSLESEDYTADSFGITLHLGEQREDVDITAYAGTLVSCRVVRSDTGEALSGVRVQGRGDDRQFNGYTNAEGLYEFRTFPGEISLYLTPPEGVYTDGDTFHEALNSQYIVGGERTDIELPLVIEGELTTATGRVVLPSRIDPSEVEVRASTGSILTATTMGIVGGVRLDDEGRFRMERAAGGREHTFYAISDDRTVAGVAVGFIPDPPANNEEIIISTEPTYVFESVLTDDNGAPVPNVKLTIRPTFNGETFASKGWNVQTDSNGRFSTDGILRGLEYVLWVRTPHADLQAAGLEHVSNMVQTTVLVE